MTLNAEASHFMAFIASKLAASWSFEISRSRSKFANNFATVIHRLQTQHSLPMSWHNTLFSPPKLSTQRELKKIKISISEICYKTSTYVGIYLIRCQIHELFRLLL